MKNKQRVLSYQDEMISNLKRLVQIPSVRQEALPTMPFGAPCAEALNCALEIGEELGFKTKNLDNYAGYIEFGAGEDLLGILCHVDIVPAGEGWEHDPFTLVQKDNKLYGRGTADDKGPLIAALYAMKIIKDMGIEPAKRVRMIIGANEESGSKCVQYYKQKEGDLTLGFSPDASFPLIFGEKGILNITYTFQNTNAKDIRLISFDAGEAANVVCPKATCVLACSGNEASVVQQQFNAYLNSNELDGENTIADETITLILKGVNAHASTPEEGINAIAFLSDFLGNIVESPLCSYINSYFSTTWDLSQHNLAAHDEYGSATCNLGIVKTHEKTMTLTIDVRYPITLSYNSLLKEMEKTAKQHGASFHIDLAMEPLFVDPASDLVQALYSAYRDVSADTENKPITIGGGTYSRNFSNTVGFGVEMPGAPMLAHMSNEYIALEDMLLSCEIIIQAILNLLELK